MQSYRQYGTYRFEYTPFRGISKKSATPEKARIQLVKIPDSGLRRKDEIRIFRNPR